MRETNWVRRERPGDRENKPSAIETLEEIAERCVREWVEHDLDEHFEPGDDFMITMPPEDLIERILSALRNERERAVQIIDEHRALDVCEDNCWTTIKAAIREGKVNRNE